MEKLPSVWCMLVVSRRRTGPLCAVEGVTLLVPADRGIAELSVVAALSA